tara:strand:- start:23 stop:427 length:405 start_codon:yes stop_codon:yes gene_type:complete
MIINGPNLNLIGSREIQIYGAKTFDEYFEKITRKYVQVNLTYFQSNIEGELIDQIQKAKVDGIIINAGGYTHTSVALRDCIAATDVPVIEVHLSNVASRESFRHESLITPVSKGCIMGFGLESYELAMYYFLNR